MNNVDPVILAAVIVAIVVLLQAVQTILNIVDKFKRKPSIDQTLQNYVRRDEFEKLRESVDKNYDKLYDLARKQTEDTNKKLDALHTSLSSWQRGIERQIGIIEGKTKSK